MGNLLKTVRAYDDDIVTEFYNLAFALKADSFGYTMAYGRPCMQWLGIDEERRAGIEAAILNRPFGDHWRYLNGGETVGRPDGLLDYEIQWWPVNVKLI